MDRLTCIDCLCTLSNPSLRLPSHYVLLGALCAISTCPVLHTFRPTRPWLRHFLSPTTNFLIIRIDDTEFRLITGSVWGSTIVTFDNWVHFMEKYYADFDSKLVFHFIIHFPDSSVLAIFIYLLRMVDRIGNSQTFKTYEKVWVFS